MIRPLALAASLAWMSMPVGATTYTLEPDYTQGVFRWVHLGFSNPTAQFAQGTGTLEFDEHDPTHASVTVTIPLSTLNTGVPALDDDFKSAFFFEISKYPAAIFKSTHVAVGPTSHQLVVTGDLTLHGTTRPVTLEVVVGKIGINPRTNLPTIGFDATATLQRSQFGLGRFVPQVSDEIRIQITCQAVDAHSPTQPAVR